MNDNTLHYDTLMVRYAGQVATVTLNRPEVRNAFNETMIADLTDGFHGAERTRRHSCGRARG